MATRQPHYVISISSLVDAAKSIPEERQRLLPCLEILSRLCHNSEAAHIRQLGEAVGSANYRATWSRQDAARWAMQYLVRFAALITDQLSRPFVSGAIQACLAYTEF